jgi:hypothetical protein
MKTPIFIMFSFFAFIAPLRSEDPVISAYSTVVSLLHDNPESVGPRGLEMLKRLADIEGIDPALRDNILVTYSLGLLSIGQQKEGGEILGALARDRQQADAILLVEHFRKKTSPQSPLQALAKTEFDFRLAVFVRAFPPIYLEVPQYRLLSETAGFAEFSWKVQVYNNTPDPVKLNIKVEFKDKEGFVLQTYTLFNKEMAPTSDQVFSDTSMMKMTLYKEVHSVSASFIKK